MDTTQTVLVTLLVVVGAGAVLSLFYRMMELDDNLWVEPLVIVVVLLFIYLVTK